MDSLELVRQSVMATFKNVHSASYSSTLVNYPNHIIVDLERQEDPFVSVELDISESEQTEIGSTDTKDSGELRIYFYYRTGTGSSAAYPYSDMLKSALALQEIDGITYKELKPLDVVSFPGWVGKLNKIKFNVIEC